MIKNIAIAARYFNWGGGLDFIHMLTEALLLNADEQDVRVYLFVPKEPNALTKILKNIFSIVKIPYNVCKGKGISYEKPIYFMTRECMDCFGDLKNNIEVVNHEISQYLFCKKLKEYRIDVVLPIPTTINLLSSGNYIGYIADLQHKCYPEFFTENEIRNRDEMYKSLLKNNLKIIVNSNSVKIDINKFYGEDVNVNDCEIYNLPFSPLLKTKYPEIEFQTIKIKYKLPNKYFIISNQFWKHKDHITAFRALKIIVDKNSRYKFINIVCTGQMYDDRFPDLIENLKKEIKAMVLEENIHFLGFIPKNHQLSIMKNSIGVIQTTLFEGGPGGGSVYDAVSLGIPAIVSNIDVNKEINGENIVYFEKGSPSDLANKIEEFVNSEHVRPSEEELIYKSDNILNRLSEILYDIIKK